MNDFLEKPKHFPTTRYQGSKRKILPWIRESLSDLEYDSVLDAFGGTGLVSYLFKEMGKSVTYNDYLKFNYLIGKALIENQNIKISNEDIDFVLTFDLDTEKRIISDNFSGFYFTDSENIWLDCIVQRILKFEDEDLYVTEIKRSMLFYALFQACLRKRPFNLFHRKNLSLRLNDVPRKFGNKTTWEKPFELEFKYFISELNSNIINSPKRCYSLNCDAFKIKGNFDLVYFDIPYLSDNGSNETSDYLKCYHFLEGISDYSNWLSRIEPNSKIKRIKNELMFNYFSTENIVNSVDLLFNKHKNSILVFSYKIGGRPSIGEIEALMRKYKRNVVVKSIHYKYALNKQNGNAQYNREVIIIGQ